jgi:hypothetical protein
MYCPRRTNEDGVKALATTFAGIPVIPIKVPQSLHLKTGMYLPTAETHKSACGPTLRLYASKIKYRVYVDRGRSIDPQWTKCLRFTPSHPSALWIQCAGLLV